ncbi:hypothetical protein ACQR0Z_25010 [Bradyrhizobium sp. HKCCYLS3077]|uniref:hypothetical protein n=1 Tax=Bradyrhizobium sp. HKCCYLS3077 TaxID=3420761 RepID=UPI003EB9ED1F
MLTKHAYAIAALAVLSMSQTQNVSAAEGEIARSQIPVCGTMYAPPFGSPAPRRACETPIPRTYKPTHRGLGYDILDLESEACFVPDSSYRLLDEILDRVTARLTEPQQSGIGIADEARVIAISELTGDVLAELGFGLYIPTETLGDALVSRSASGMPPRYIFDCDTGSLILLTVAEYLRMPASLVEITLNSGSLHNYVRWPLSDGRSLDWDTNGRGLCVSPKDQPTFQAQSMSRSATMGYAATMRAPLWKKQKQYIRALSEYRQDMRDRPGHPSPFNNLAWLIVTTDFSERESLRAEALQAATQAVSLQRQAGAAAVTRENLANYLDTLACAYAYAGDYKNAIASEMEAVSLSANVEFRQRQAMFANSPPNDCTGAQ